MVFYSLEGRIRVPYSEGELTEVVRTRSFDWRAQISKGDFLRIGERVVPVESVTHVLCRNHVVVAYNVVWGERCSHVGAAEKILKFLVNEYKGLDGEIWEKYDWTAS